MSKLAPMATQDETYGNSALLLQAARDERDAALRALAGALTELDARKAESARFEHSVTVATAEFGENIARHRREAKEREETRLHLTACLNSEKNRADDARLEVERLRAEIQKYGEFPVGSSQRAADTEKRLDALWKENEALAHKVVDAEALRDLKIREAARLAERWIRLGDHLAQMRRATNALAREVGVLRQKLARVEESHGLLFSLGDIDAAIAEALAASQAASENGS